MNRRQAITTTFTAVELDETKKSYLHPLADTDAARIGVGLFRKPPE